MTKMDLDSSLDDIIKHKKQKKVTVTTTKKVIKKQTEKTKKVKSIISKSNINSRLGGGGKGFTKTVNSNQGSNRADPSQIIITKNVPFTTQQPSPGRTDISSRLSFANKKPAILSRISSSSITDRLGSNEQRPASDRLGSNERRPVSDRLGSNERRPASDRLGSNERRPASDRLGSNEQRLVSDRLGNNEQRPASITIRGTSRANSQNNSSTTGFSIRGESGPSTVLLSNLDAHTTADDVMVSCQVFGKITSCDVLRDKSGLSYGEAEIKFSTKTAALDCIAQLDNEYADGRLIRAILRDPKPPKTISYAAKQIRSTLEHASGKMYADQMQNPRYDVQR